MKERKTLKMWRHACLCRSFATHTGPETDHKSCDAYIPGRVFLTSWPLAGRRPPGSGNATSTLPPYFIRARKWTLSMGAFSWDLLDSNITPACYFSCYLLSKMLILQGRSYGLVYRIQGAIEWLHYHVKHLVGWSLASRSSTGIITQKIFACLQ